MTVQPTVFVQCDCCGEWFPVATEFYVRSQLDQGWDPIDLCPACEAGPDLTPQPQSSPSCGSSDLKLYMVSVSLTREGADGDVESVHIPALKQARSGNDAKVQAMVDISRFLPFADGWQVPDALAVEVPAVHSRTGPAWILPESYLWRREPPVIVDSLK